MVNRGASIDDHVRELAYSRLALIVLVVLIPAAAACSKSPSSAELRPIPVSSSTTSPTPAQLKPPLALDQPRPTPAAPDIAEVANALARCFDKSLTIDQNYPQSFVLGDFNGDGSQDLAVITKAGDNALPEINNELANWTLEDPHEVPTPGTKVAEQQRRPKPVKAEPNDQLLAIIHGVGAEGWRNSEARQTFLLRNAVGAKASVENADQLREFSSPANVTFRGDVISETVNGHRGLIFWTGARYAWAPQR
jgi:FG-GAP repeat protein